MHARGLDLLLAAALLATLPAATQAQLERRRAPDGEPAKAPAGIPRSPAPRADMPFAGEWRGAVTAMKHGPGTGRPLHLLFDVAGGAGTSYAAIAVLPNGERSSPVGTSLANGELRWQQPNIDGGRWLYTARLVAPDSIAGTLTLKSEHWPDAPTGTYVLARRRARGG